MHMTVNRGRRWLRINGRFYTGIWYFFQIYARNCCSFMWDAHVPKYWVQSETVCDEKESKNKAINLHLSSFVRRLSCVGLARRKFACPSKVTYYVALWALRPIHLLHLLSKWSTLSQHLVVTYGITEWNKYCNLALHFTGNVYLQILSCKALIRVHRENRSLKTVALRVTEWLEHER